MGRNFKITLFLLAFIYLFPFHSLSASAPVRLEAPQSAARGDAFLARGISASPVENFVFFWRGNSYSIKAGKGADQNYMAEILLPVPLEEKAVNLVLGLGASQRGKAGALERTRADIKLFDRKRQVQKLTVDKKFVNPPRSELARIKADREKVRAALGHRMPERQWTLPLQRPVPGSVSSQFGMKRVFNGQPRSVHRGLDLRGASGSPIRACADGVAVLVDNLYYSGNTVYINHGDGVFSSYLHMSESNVKPGQHVAKGEIIGRVGATGRVTGPHLHLGFIVQGQLVDPLPFLEKAPAAQ